MKIPPLILACLAAYPATAQTEPEGTFRVHVVNSVTSAPIGGANVVLERGRDRLWGRTGAGGVFTCQTHASGNYLLSVTRKGYRMTGVGMGKTVEVKGGETDITVEIQPLGVLAGRVLDQYGDPVRHALVHTEDKREAPGYGEYYESDSVATTDDRGEYRITEVEPGQHYVAVEYDSIHEGRTSGIRSRYRWPQSGGLVLYPDAADLEQAREVEVAAGATTRLNDVHLKVQRTLTISGRIKPPPAETGQGLSLQRTNKLALASSPTVQGATSEADGSFRIQALPGKYILTASDGKTGRVSKPLTLDVRDKDITGLEIELTSGFEISGRIIVDGAAPIDFPKLLLDFGGPLAKIDATGNFRANLFQGKGMFVLQGLPEDWYTKSVLVAGKRIVGKQFEIEPGSTEVAVTLSPNGARVSISLEGANAAEALFVALVPDSGEAPDPESGFGAQPDGSGKYIVRAVPPGAYRVFTFDASNWALLMTPAVLLEKYRKLAPLIDVVEGEQKEVVIRAQRIPME